jgi:hypothetical protein
MRLVRVPLGRVHGKAGMVDRSILKIRGVRARISSEILRRRGERERERERERLCIVNW